MLYGGIKKSKILMNKEVKSMEEKLLTVKELANFVGLSEPQVWNYINKGIIPTLKEGITKIKESDAIEFKEWYENKKSGIVESTFMLDWDESLKILPTFPYIPNLANPEAYKKYAHKPCFLVSNKGNIINASTLRKRKVCEVDHEYLQVNLYGFSRKGTQPLVHQLVALLWCPNYLNKKEIHHIDLNRKNNVFDNLLWVTEKEHDEIHNLLKSVNNDINNPEYRKRIKEIQEANSYPDGVEPSRVIHHLDYKDSPNCYMYVTPKSYEKYLETENENDLVIIGESHF